MTEQQTPLFDPSDFPEITPDNGETFAPLQYPIWTENKATLIFRYLYYFVMITRHGTYIDGFAGPQNDDHKMWAAKLVIESKPAWFRHFHLVELDKKKIPDLEALKTAEDASGNKPKRNVHIYPGDFNVLVDQILGAGTIGAKEATFCLLDQRTFECEWETVRKLAGYKPSGENKIELFYFLPMGWLDRSFHATKDDAPIRRWWGRDDWRVVWDIKDPHARATAFTARFKNDLGYKSANAWPIYKSAGGGQIMYLMIHATDHPEAPKLMRRAYQRAVDPLEPIKQLKLELGIGEALTE